MELSQVMGIANLALKLRNARDSNRGLTLDHSEVKTLCEILQTLAKPEPDSYRVDL